MKGGGGKFRVDKFLLLMNYLKNVVQEEGRSNKDRRNEVKVMKRREECGLLAECLLCLNWVMKRLPFR